MQNAKGSVGELIARATKPSWITAAAISLVADTEQQIKLPRNATIIGNFHCTKQTKVEFVKFVEDAETDSCGASTPPFNLANIPVNQFLIPDLEVDEQEDEYVYMCVLTTENATLTYRLM